MLLNSVLEFKHIQNRFYFSKRKDFMFEKNPGISVFVTPLEILEKAKLHLWVFHKVVWHSLETSRQKTKTNANSARLFLDHCSKFHLLFNLTLEFQHALSLIPLRNSMYSTPTLLFGFSLE